MGGEEGDGGWWAAHHGTSFHVEIHVRHLVLRHHNECPNDIHVDATWTEEQRHGQTRHGIGSRKFGLSGLVPFGDTLFLYDETVLVTRHAQVRGITDTVQCSLCVFDTP